MALTGITDAADVPRDIILRGPPDPQQPDRCATPRVDLKE
jgi:hypothetical protein